jgi:hypothetical protein
MRMSSVMRRRSGVPVWVVVSMAAAPLMNEADCLDHQLRRTTAMTKHHTGAEAHAAIAV